MVLPNIKMKLPQVYMCSPSWTLLPPPSPYHHPYGSSQCTSPKNPVSCIEPGLATRSIYDIICISMPFSQIILPSPSPTESKRLFYTSVSLLLSPIQGYCYHLSKFHIYALVYCIGVFLSGLLHSVRIVQESRELWEYFKKIFFPRSCCWMLEEVFLWSSQWAAGRVLWKYGGMPKTWTPWNFKLFI